VSGALLAGVLAVAGLVATRAALRAGDRAAVVGSTGRLTVTPPARLSRALVDSAAPWPAQLVWPAWLGATAVVGILAFAAGGPGLVGVGLVTVVGAPVLALAATRERSVTQVEAALPDVLDAVARSLRSGVTVRQAVAEVADGSSGRLGTDLATVVAEADGGLPLVDALDGWAARCPTAGVRLTVAALGVAIDAGGAAARAVDGVAATLRANLAVAGEVRAQSSQARLSGLVIAASPLAFGALAAGTDGRTAHFLLRTPFGLACLAGGLTLDALAAWWMHRITGAPA
jgi:tight adherence protein B